MVVYKINNEHWVAGKSKKTILKWYRDKYPNNEIKEVNKESLTTGGLYVSINLLTETELNNDVKLFHKEGNDIYCLLTFNTILKKSNKTDTYLVGTCTRCSEETNE